MIFAFAGCLAVFAWKKLHSESRVRSTLAQVQPCKTIEEIIAILGPPYGVYTDYPPKLGETLIGPLDDPATFVIYAFTIEKMPPLFLVVKVNRADGQVVAMGIATS
ncbi:MAG: hypothetical protein ACKV19_06835 [Verrucomicrobiales bacterium]